MYTLGKYLKTINTSIYILITFRAITIIGNTLTRATFSKVEPFLIIVLAI